MGNTVYENISTAPYCSMKVGGTAEKIIFPDNEKDLLSVISSSIKTGCDFKTVGNMSNVIFACENYKGNVIITTSVRGISLEGEYIKCSCGEPLSSLALFAAKNSFSGFEFCYGIPGTIGGAVFMNAGAYGGEIADVFVKGDFVNEKGEVTELTREELGFGYRKSRLQTEKLYLLNAVFKGNKGDEPDIRAKMAELMAKRREKQPLEYPSCGSTFKRPEGHFAGALIESAGLKGFSVGGAAVSEKHAGFVINKNNATYRDVLDVIKYVSDKVYAVSGVRLEPEIQLIV